MAESFDKREPRSRSGVTAVLGDTPGRVAVRLIVLSLVVGFLMTVFGVTPNDLFRTVERLFSGVFDDGFAFLRQLGGYVVTGAVIVVPVWIALRVMAAGKKR